METRNPSPLTGLLTLDLSSSDSVKNITYTLPQQMIYLRGFRVEMASAVVALAKKVVYLELPVYNVSKMIDTNPGFTYLPIMLENATVSVAHGMDLPIAMASDLQQTFRVRVLDGADFSPLTNSSEFVSATFQFSCEVAHL